MMERQSLRLRGLMSTDDSEKEMIEPIASSLVIMHHPTLFKRENVARKVVCIILSLDGSTVVVSFQRSLPIQSRYKWGSG